MTLQGDRLGRRGNWQDKASARGESPEIIAFYILRAHFANTPLRVIDKPRDLKRIYGDRGIEPDLAVRNTDNGRTIYIEMKRQKPRGNAHERACKYFAFGIQNAARKIGNLPDNVFPFWLIFSNGLARNAIYRNEISFWFQGYEGHCFFWKNLRQHEGMTAHFDRHIAPLLGYGNDARLSP